MSIGGLVPPLRIYVVWHPECADGRALARTVYDWFHAPTAQLFRAGLGVPVHYRFHPWDASSARPRAIDTKLASMSAVVALVDEHMVSAPDWADYLRELADLEAHGDDLTLFPVALHESAHRLSERIRRVNYLPVDARDDPSRMPPEERVGLRSLRLRRTLTEVCGRLLLGRLRAGEGRGGSEPAPPLTIFLSHAKLDGTEVAEELKAAIYSYGQIKAYYDKNDLPIGSVFERELTRAAKTDSAAMISVLSDAYARRPWCRREVLLARTPVRDLPGSSCWRVQPLLVVDALRTERTRSIPELGSAPMIRWQPGRADEFLDMILLEVLLGSYHQLQARGYAEKPGRHFVNWVPDLPTLLELQCCVGDDRFREVVYPGHGLAPSELATLRRLFPKLRLRTFDEVSR